MNPSLTPHRDEIESTPEGLRTRYSYFAPSEAVLRPLMEDLFANHWHRLVVGPILDGAEFEIRFNKPPAVSFADGNMTVNPGSWHFHMRIGAAESSESEELRKTGPVAKAAVIDVRGGVRMRSWGLRFWNGRGQQMTTIFLRNQRPSDTIPADADPERSRLDLYYQLRSRLLDEPMPVDVIAAAAAPWPE